MTGHGNTVEPQFVRRRRRSVLGKRERRAVFVFLLASGLAAGLIAAAAFLKREPPQIMPPESAEETALRSSPDNAFPVIMEAVNLLPSPLPPLLATNDDNAGFVGPYIPQPGSLGFLLNEGRPDDDAEFQAQLTAVAPAVDVMRTALTRPHFRLPTLYPPAHMAVLHRLRALATFAMAAAINRIRTGVSVEERALVLDLMRLGRLVDQDGGFESHSWALMVQTAALSTTWDAAMDPIPTDRRTALLAELTELSLAHAPVKHHLEFEWRVLDRPDAYWILIQNPQGAEELSEDVESFFHRLMIGRAMGKLRRHVLANRDLYLEAAELPLTEFQDWRSQHPELFSRHVFFDPIQGIWGASNGRAAVDAWLRGLNARIQIEQYKEQRGEYPATLEEAGVDLLDPFGNAPFHYRVHPGDFTLYSIGSNQRDDDAYPVHDKDIVIHRAAAEPAIDALPFDPHLLNLGFRR